MKREEALLALANGLRIKTLNDRVGHYKMGESGMILHLWANKQSGYINTKLYSRDGYEVSNGKLVKGCSDKVFARFLENNVMLYNSITMQVEVEV